METLIKQTRLILAALLIVRSSGQLSDNSTSLSVASGKIDGKKLIEMGKSMDLPVLKLLGTAFVNLEKKMDSKMCRIDPCEPWSQWTECSTTDLGSFGSRSRWRSCWYDKTNACNRDGKETIENESHVCEGFCPAAYEISESSGLCLKLYTNTTNKEKATAICQENNGHLLNTDTEERWSETVLLASGHSLSTFWLDGQRSTNGGPWTYMNGVDPEANGVSSKWHTGEPSNREPELCKVFDRQGGKFTWCDRECTSAYAFVCEYRYQE